MKKVYVKPVMESEAFVANEYVATCSRIVCIEGESDYAKDPNFDCMDEDQDGYGYFITYRDNKFVRVYYYTGQINGEDPESHGLLSYYHEVREELLDSSDPHPNASV